MPGWWPHQDTYSQGVTPPAGRRPRFEVPAAGLAEDDMVIVNDGTRSKRRGENSDAHVKQKELKTEAEQGSQDTKLVLLSTKAFRNWSLAAPSLLPLAFGLWGVMPSDGGASGPYSGHLAASVVGDRNTRLLVAVLVWGWGVVTHCTS
ncbi:hypothetical protein EDB83DRAFT_2316744 [Lactarius deliciosus]|nr:hypothetical protein EDB83DRAFT_2316744 [Lactarius deliciosus]